MDLLRERYIRLNGVCPVEGHLLQRIEETLGLSLPGRLRDACAFFDGSGCGGFFHNFDPTIEPNIIDETLRLRERINLPSQYVALGEPPISLLVLDCRNGSVIWCDAYDAARFATGDRMHSPTIWSDFSECLSYALNEEEDARSEL